MYPNVECPSCSSKQQQRFSGEVAIHFSGLDGLNKPIVFVFPKITVCMDCGAAHFKVPELELQVLVSGSQIDGAAVSRVA